MKTTVIANFKGAVSQRIPPFWGSEKGRGHWKGNWGDVSEKEAVEREWKDKYAKWRRGFVRARALTRYRESERIKGNRRVIQPAHNVSTLFSVGGRPRGKLPSTRGEEIQQLSQRKSSSYISAALGKQNKLTRGPWSPELEPGLRLSQFMRWKASWKIYSFWRQESNALCVQKSRERDPVF